MWSGFRWTCQHWRGSFRRTPDVSTPTSSFNSDVERKCHLSAMGKYFSLFSYWVHVKRSGPHIWLVFSGLLKKRKNGAQAASLWLFDTWEHERVIGDAVKEWRREERQRNTDVWTTFLIFHHVKRWLCWKPLLLWVGLPTSGEKGGQKNSRPCSAALVDSSITVKEITGKVEEC